MHRVWIALVCVLLHGAGQLRLVRTQSCNVAVDDTVRRDDTGSGVASGDEVFVVCRNVSSMQELASVANVSAAAAWRLAVVNERGASLTVAEHVNPTLHTTVEHLNLSLAGELHIGDHGFRDFQQLTTIDLSNSDLTALKSHWFRPDNRIQLLDLSQNQLSATLTRDALRRFARLQHVRFTANDIDAYQTGAFEDAAALRTLHLNRNRIARLTQFGQLPELQLLDLSDNALRQISANAFAELPALQNLSLAGNAIAVLEERSFAGLRQLRTLNVSGNSLRAVAAGWFPGFVRVNLRVLDLSENDIVSVQPQAFVELRLLQQLRLDKNALRHLDDTTFAGLRSLRKLSAASNAISNVQPRTFAALAALEQLVLAENQLSQVSGEWFGVEMPRLRKLWLQSNGLQVVQPRSFEHTPALDYLSVSANELRELPAELFAALPALRKLHVAHNRLEQLDGALFNHTAQLEELLLAHNRLAFFPDLAVDLPRLRKVSLEGNPWQCACLDDMLQWLQLRGIAYRTSGNPYFAGARPICVVTPVAVCVKNMRLVREHHIVERYEEAFSRGRAAADGGDEED